MSTWQYGHPMIRFVLIAMLSAAAVFGCEGGDSAKPSPEHEHAENMAPTNRIDIPPAVRQNLGISFVTVEARRVSRTLRVSGRFEYQPTSVREYRTMLPGRVELLVDQFASVEPGTPLYRIDSPDWRLLQRDLTDAEAAIERLTARVESFGPLLAAHRNHEVMLERTIEIRRERISQLEAIVSTGGGRTGDLLEVRALAAGTEAELAEVLEKEAELSASYTESKAELGAAIAKRDFLLESAASLLRMDVEAVVALQEVPGQAERTGSGKRPLWRNIREITVLAEQAGIVESIGLSNGGWADQTAVVMSVVQPERLRFRGSALQSDIGVLRNGQPATIVPPTPTRAPGLIDMLDTMEGTLTIAPSGNAGERTIDLIVVPASIASWARNGIAAQLEIVTEESAEMTLAIPRAAVHRDGLVSVFFRRDPGDANKAIRIEADLGINDGRWIVVNSGLRLGDEVVLDGSFQLMLATATAAGGMPRGGHFHADGTFHADDH